MTYAIGDFIIYGEHEEDPGGLSIKIIPHSHHAAYGWWNESTRKVLEAMVDLPIKGATVLDFGCGASAILALAAHKLGAKRVVACEVHPEIATIAKRQIQANSARIKVWPEDDGETEYDVIIANIGDAELAGRLSRRSKRGIGTSQEGDLLSW
jgi:ribosomal protein L11 methyltransferase